MELLRGWTWTVFLFVACGGSHGKGGGAGGDDPALESTSVEVVPGFKTQIESLDGRFWIDVPKDAFAAPITLMVAPLDEELLGAVSTIYRASSSPADVVLNSGVRLVANIRIDRGFWSNDLELAQRSASPVYFDTLSANFAAGSLSASVRRLGDFVAVDADVFVPCPCDISAECDNECLCDAACVPPGCAAEQWRCTSGECIAAAAECNGSNECLDGSDEDAHCRPQLACGTDEWRCDDGTCIVNSYRCNKRDDCPDASDEGEECRTACGFSEMRCGSGQCVPTSSMCNGTNDCPDGSDEVGCTPQACFENQFTCADGSCVLNTFLCNGIAECPDESDELDCNSPPDAFEPDDVFGEAKAIVPDAPQTRSIHSLVDADFATFAVPTPSHVVLATVGDRGDTYVELFDGNQNIVGWDDDSAGERFSRLEIDVQAGTYFVKVTEFRSNAFIPNYTLTLAVTEIPPFLDPPAEVNATVADDIVTVTWNPVAGAMRYSVIFAEGDSTYESVPFTPGLVAQEGASPLMVTTNTTTLTGLPLGASYRMAVRAQNDVSESKLSQIVTVRMRYVPDVFEEDDSFDTARGIESGEEQHRSIDVEGDRDVAVFVLTDTSDIVFETNGDSGDTFLRLFDRYHNLLDEDDDGGRLLFSRLSHSALPPGTYFVQVNCLTAIGAYTLRFDATPLQSTPIGTPTQLVVTAQPGGAALTWKTVPEADAYRVYYDEDANPPYSATTIANEGASPVYVTTAALTLTGLAPGVRIYLAVSAVNDGIEGDLSSPTSVVPTPPTTP